MRHQSHNPTRRGVFSGTALCLIGVLASLMVWPGTVQAQLGGLVDTTTSTVTNTTSSTTSTLTDTTSTLTGTIGTVLGTTTVLSGTGTLVAGTSDALQASELTAGVPSLLTGEVLHAITIGYPDQIDSEASLAALALNVAGINIGADFVMARALAAINATPIGTSNIDNLSINGVPFSVTGEPNQMISVAGGVVVLNEQQTLPDGTLVVNALHAIVSGVADVVVGSAMAGYSGGQASAVKASY